jgi:hypothetical protein
MANTLTNLIPLIHRAADIVSRELVGMIPAVTLNATAEQVALNQSIIYLVVPSYAASDIVAAATGPDPSDSVIGNQSMTISKSRSVTFYWTGEEQNSLSTLYATLLRDQFAQAMRTLTNEVEADLATLYVGASRAYGTAGTTPFATAGDYTQASNVLKILLDNGAPNSDLQLVINTAAGANLRGKQGGRGVDLEGTSNLLRQGVLQDIHGFKIRESAQIKNHTKGAGTGALINNAATEAVGETTLTYDTLTVNTTGIKAGDILTTAADTTNKYVVTTGTTAASGDLVIGAPGLRIAAPDNNALTVGDSYAANLAFARSAIHALIRAPAMPDGGDAADDVTSVTDPVSGITFQVALYRQRRRIAYEVGLAWGVKLVKPEHVAILLG